MITTVVSSAEFTYPDRFAYPSSAPSADVFTARGTCASFQVLLRGLESPALDVSFRDLPAVMGRYGISDLNDIIGGAH